MTRHVHIVLLGVLCILASWTQRAESASPAAVVCAKDAAPAEKLAAKEVRRYIYLRTGDLLPIVDAADPLPKGGAILVGKGAIQSLGARGASLELREPKPEQYRLKTGRVDGQPVLAIVGGDAFGTLYAAYRLAEHLGVRFYLDGDVVPDQRVAWDWPDLDETRRPLFDRRGIQPFHDFPEGPDWWNRDGYKAILGQLPKLGMNFFGLHCYPEGGVGPEPLVWIGPPSEVDANEKVKASYPARHFTTDSFPPAWGFVPGKTSDFVFGAAAMFDCDNHGADYMRDTYPWNKMSPEQCNSLFERMGSFLGDVFGYARRLGIKTCLGTETPLTVPTAVKQRLQAAGKNPADPAVVQDLYEGMFRRIAQVHPLDYYWFWTPEGWTWEAVKPQQIDATLTDLRAAMAAAKKADAHFTLATCGWVLGPPSAPAMFDELLPKEMPMSCINRTVGNTPVEPGFARVEGRPKWAIPWLEDDPGMTIPQLWAGRMRKDAADALKYGCTGLMGIHWRTRILGPNVSALAQAAWDQSGWSDDPKRATASTKLPEGAIGGEAALFPANEIAGADEAPIYQNVRYNVNAYHIDVPDGSYAVTLKLCEPFYGEQGKRVFGAKVQGNVLFDNLDLFTKVGKNRALDFTAKDVKVSGGGLNIEFLYETEFPCIAGIVIEGTATGTNQAASGLYRRKINCGGPAYKDYEADLATLPGGTLRFLPVADFYADWARVQFGPEVEKTVAELFTRLDGRLPRPADWVTGPGSIRPDVRPWAQVQKDYAFVDEMASLRTRIVGAGNLERFDYWLNNFRYLRAIAQANCIWARYNEVRGKVAAEKDPQAQKKLARELALPVRKELVAAFAELHRHLLATVTNAGEMGNVSNWQQQTLPVALGAPGKELAIWLGEDLPADAMPSAKYAGEPRLFVREVRTGIVAGEPLTLTVIMLGVEPSPAQVCWRSLGTGPFAKTPLQHVTRGVYTVTLPADCVRSDFEYYVQATAGDKSLVFPATAPALNQTVVVTE